MYVWAYACRDTAGVGWYKEQPWYTQTGYRQSTIPLSDKDVEISNKIGAHMVRIDHIWPKRALCCRYYYGAYPGAENQQKKERLKFLEREHGISRRDVYREKDSVISMLEGAFLLD